MVIAAFTVGLAGCGVDGLVESFDRACRVGRDWLEDVAGVGASGRIACTRPASGSCGSLRRYGKGSFQWRVQNYAAASCVDECELRTEFDGSASTPGFDAEVAVMVAR
jgi:hypothetical protein